MRHHARARQRCGLTPSTLLSCRSLWHCHPRRIAWTCPPFCCIIPDVRHFVTSSVISAIFVTSFSDMCYFCASHSVRPTPMLFRHFSCVYPPSHTPRPPFCLSQSVISVHTCLHAWHACGTFCTPSPCASRCSHACSPCRSCRSCLAIFTFISPFPLIPAPSHHRVGCLYDACNTHALF